MRPVICFGLLAGFALVGGRWEEPNSPLAPGARAADMPRSAEAEAEIAFNERILKEAGIVPDGPGLLAYFRARVVRDEDLERLKIAVRRLGDDNFELREKASQELLAAGRMALPLLRPALTDPDPERVRRAETCIEDIERFPFATVVTAAAQLISTRPPPGAAEALLASLPWIDDEALREAIHSALSATGVQDGKVVQVLVTAASDKEAVRRAAAAHVLGGAGPEQRRQALRLLADADVSVRFYAACSLLRGGEGGAVPALLAQLTEAPLPLAWRAEDLLCRLAGEKMPSISPGNWDEASRRKCRDGWEAWWKENQGKVNLARVNVEDSYLGLNLIAELDGAARAGGAGRIWECGPDGKLRWEIANVPRSIDAQVLRGGRILVAEHGQSRVTERDREGKIQWEQKVTNQPVCAQRMPNGNTFIVTYNELLEVTPDNKIVYSHKRLNGMIYHGQKLRNGNMVFVQSNNQVVELDSSGKEIRSVPVGNTGGWASVEKLPNGHYLVALYSGGRVVEVDDMGKELWQCTVQSPGHATRLRNGNTLVASIEGRKVFEINRSGTVVWQQATQGRPFHAYRR
jgi:HEAT repeat protein